jgi:hypothetical protein
MQMSDTPQLGYGYYSPYIASVMDIGRILDSFRTAQYQYIPALASPHGDKLALTLNTAPSFHNPMSVLVVALPAVERAQLPPLHAVDPKEIYCAHKTALVLPVEGAPLVFATGYAHDMTLTLSGSDGRTLKLPASADAAQGGFLIDTSALGNAALSNAALGDSVEATLHGYWGFEPYHGPSFRLMNARATAWKLAAGDEAALIVGRQDTVHLRADSVSCIDGILYKDASGKELKAEWKRLKADEVEVKLPLQDAEPGAMTLLVTQYGGEQPQSIPVHSFAEAARFDGFEIHSGDVRGVLKGSRLDEVANLAVHGVVFTPGELSSRQGSDELPLVATDEQAAAALKPERPVAVKITLKDGRVLTLSAAVDGPRPRVTLIGKNVQPSPHSSASNIQLTDAGELPQDSTLIFSLRAQSPAAFTHDESVEIATLDESSTVVLGLGAATPGAGAPGGLTLENAHVAVATLNTAKSFDASAYGPLKFRATSKGLAGDWQPLANLVRLPMLTALDCPATADLACKLSGSNLYLIDSVAGNAQFTDPVQVPEGFLGAALPVPHPREGTLFVKLRDNPLVVNPVTLTVREVPAAPAAPVAPVATTAPVGPAAPVVPAAPVGPPPVTRSADDGEAH